jgi:hypothetical protein
MIRRFSDWPKAFYISTVVSLKIPDSKRNMFTAIYLHSSQYVLKSMMMDVVGFNLDYTARHLVVTSLQPSVAKTCPATAA